LSVQQIRRKATIPRSACDLDWPVSLAFRNVGELVNHLGKITASTGRGEEPSQQMFRSSRGRLLEAKALMHELTGTHLSTSAAVVPFIGEGDELVGTVMERC
jgi:hypothetical protein